MLTNDVVDLAHRYFVVDVGVELNVEVPMVLLETKLKSTKKRTPGLKIAKKNQGNNHLEYN